MVDSIIFDLDGTLWNPLDTCVIAWNQVLESSNTGLVITKQRLRSVMGLQHDKIADALFPSLTDAQREDLVKEINANEINAILQKGGKLYRNTKTVLKTLKHKFDRLFIVSNCQMGYIEAFLSHHRLDHFFIDYESSGNTGLGKAENIQLIIQRHGLSRPVYVGDTLDDLIACNQAKIPFIFAKYGFGKNVEAPYQISSIGDLINTNILHSLSKTRYSF